MKKKTLGIITLLNVLLFGGCLLSQTDLSFFASLGSFPNGSYVGRTITFSGTGEATSTTKRYSKAGTTPGGASFYVICDNCGDNTLLQNQLGNAWGTSSSSKKMSVYFSDDQNGTTKKKFQNLTNVQLTFNRNANVDLYVSEYNKVYNLVESYTTTSSSVSIPLDEYKYIKLDCSSTTALESALKTVVLTYNCEDVYIPDPEITSLSIGGAYQTEFYTGDTFNHDGLIVYANYDDGSQIDVTNEATFSSPNMSIAGTKTITIKYSEFSTTYKITVTARPTLSGISLTNQYITANKTFYYGDTFSRKGVTVTANYSNSTTKDVSDLATFSGYNMTSVGSQTVTVSYTDNGVTKTATYSITVKKKLDSISLSGDYETEFEQGDTFNHDGLIVTAHYNGAADADVTSSVTFSGYDMSTVGEQTVTVSYTEDSTGLTSITKTATYSINVKQKETPSSFKGGTYLFSGFYGDVTLVFNEDATGTYNYSGSTLTFTWVLSGTVMTLTRSDSVSEDLFGAYRLFNGASSVSSQSISATFDFFKFYTYSSSGSQSLRTFTKQ